MGRPSDARERLIAAAQEVIYAQSYEAVSVDELCAAAGVRKSSFYHFFSSKQELLLVVLESQWQRIEETFLKPAFTDDLPPQEQILRFFELVQESQQAQKQRSGHTYGCPIGNLTVEMSTIDEMIRERAVQIFQQWLGYFERMLAQAKEQRIVPATLDIALTAQALTAYFEGVLLLAKGKNDPALLQTLRECALSLMQFQGVPALRET
jgi:TetR/AcrR family transcriptional repressor of nem operon